MVFVFASEILQNHCGIQSALASLLWKSSYLSVGAWIALLNQPSQVFHYTFYLCSDAKQVLLKNWEELNITFFGMTQQKKVSYWDGKQFTGLIMREAQVFRL